MFKSMEEHPGARFLLVLTSLVVVVAGLRAAAPILVPFSLALFLAIVSMPVMFALRVRRTPAPLAIFLTVALDALLFGFVVLLAANSLGNLNERWPLYQTQLETRFLDGFGWLRERGFVPAGYEFDGLGSLIDTGAIVGFLGGTLQTVASVFTVGFLVALIMVFILAEATVFPFKFQAILGSSRHGRARMTKTIREVQAYLGIKTLVSLATGITAGSFCWLMGLDFPILLGITAFVLNFIPTIGSIIAAIPAMALALILHDVSWTLLVALGYLAINTLFGNIVEPNLMGRRLGLSTLVVVLSLIFWGWLWGPIGALLSVPLTMVLKIILENTPDLRWAAILLDKAPPQARQAEASAGRERPPEGPDLRSLEGPAAADDGPEPGPTRPETHRHAG
jgi:AI-2 transport protein TqsA